MLTGYDPDGVVFELGKKIEVIAKRWILVDKLKSRLYGSAYRLKRNQRYTMNLQKLQISAKISRMIKDCHHKISKWLSENYHQILLPKFETSKMVEKTTRKIGKATVRKILQWSHWSFKELLRQKMERNGNILIDCTEEYTSKTCTCCGRINHVLGASKRFRCWYKDCEYRGDRDISAARNIYLKNAIC